jgi:hypothetical protein
MLRPWELDFFDYLHGKPRQADSAPAAIPAVPDDYDGDQVFAWAVLRPNAKLEEIPCDLSFEQVIAQLGGGNGETARFDAEGGYRINGPNVAYFDPVEHFFSWAGQKKWPAAIREAATMALDRIDK